MTSSTTPDELEEYLTDPDELYAVNEVCNKLLAAWSRDELSGDTARLVLLLNAGAARAVKRVRELKKPENSA